MIRVPPVSRTACTSKASWQIDLERVGQLVEQSELVIVVRVFRLRGSRSRAGIGSALVFTLYRESAPEF